MKLILASASPRRRELLQQIGLDFEIIKSDVEEVITKTLPSEIVMELALQKAMDVAEKNAEKNVQDCLIIGSDTIVSVDNRILGKPKDKAEAYEMIKSIQGRTHQVYTGVAVVKCPSSTVINFADVTDVEVYPMTDEQILAYINTSEPYDKAGAYGIQGLFGKHVKGIKGDYNTVVGLPVARLYNELYDLGLI